MFAFWPPAYWAPSILQSSATYCSSSSSKHWKSRTPPPQLYMWIDRTWELLPHQSMQSLFYCSKYSRKLSHSHYTQILFLLFYSLQIDFFKTIGQFTTHGKLHYCLLLNNGTLSSPILREALCKCSPVQLPITQTSDHPGHLNKWDCTVLVNVLNASRVHLVLPKIKVIYSDY